MVVPIVFCADGNYGRYLPVAVQSIIENSSLENEYHIIIFDCGIPRLDIAVLERQIARYPHFHLRVENIAALLEKYKTAFSIPKSGYWTVAMYGRFFIPELCSEYDKVIYADVDIIFNCNIKHLIEFDLKDNYIAGVIDNWVEDKRYTNKYDEMYIKEILLLDDSDIYINTGLLIFNIHIMKSNKITKKLIIFSANNSLKLPDQDAINSICAGKISYLTAEWTFWDRKVNRNIIHFASPIKPWHNLFIEGSGIWWLYAAKTEIYGQLLAEALVFYNQAELARIGKPLTYRLLGIPLLTVRAWAKKKKYYFGKMRSRHVAETRFNARTGYWVFYLFALKLFSRQ